MRGSLATARSVSFAKARDRDLLTLTTGEFVRVTRRDRRWQSDRVPQSQNEALALGCGAHAVGGARPRRCERNRHARIERAERIQEDHLLWRRSVPRPRFLAAR